MQRAAPISLPHGTVLPSSELRFEFSRSGGPGGQNVNKVNTRVTLLFALDASPSLNADQKRAIRRALGTRISQDGILRVVSSKHRTQSANREAAFERLTELLTRALTPPKRRKKTRMPASAHAKRLEQKARHGQKKRARGERSTDW